MFENMKKTRENISILSLTTTYPEKKDSTKHKFVHNINKELIKLGADILVLTPHVTNSLVRDEIDSVPIKRFRYYPNKYENTESGIVNILKSKLGCFKLTILVCSFIISSIFECAKKNPDIIHAHWAFPSGFIGYILSLIFKKKLFITVYGAEFASLEKNFSFLNPISKHGLKKSNKVIAIANFGKNKVIELGIHPNRVEVIRAIPNFIDYQYKEEEKQNFRDSISKSNVKILLFVGRFIERKGIPYLIKALTHLPRDEIHLIIAGSGPLLQELKKLVQDHNLEKNVTFFINPSDYKLGLLYEVSDIFILPSIVDSNGDTEGLGLVMVEAMKFKIPVIATRVGGIVDVIQHNENGLLANQKDSESLASCIKKLLSDKEFTHKLIDCSQQTMKEYSPEIIGRKYFELFIRKNNN